MAPAKDKCQVCKNNLTDDRCLRCYSHRGSVTREGARQMRANAAAEAADKRRLASNPNSPGPSSGLDGSSLLENDDGRNSELNLNEVNEPLSGGSNSTLEAHSTEPEGTAMPSGLERDPKVSLAMTVEKFARTLSMITYIFTFLRWPFRVQFRKLTGLAVIIVGFWACYSLQMGFFKETIKYNLQKQDKLEFVQILGKSEIQWLSDGFNSPRDLSFLDVKVTGMSSGYNAAKQRIISFIRDSEFKNTTVLATVTPFLALDGLTFQLETRKEFRDILLMINQPVLFVSGFLHVTSKPWFLPFTKDIAMKSFQFQFNVQDQLRLPFDPLDSSPKGFSPLKLTFPSLTKTAEKLNPNIICLDLFIGVEFSEISTFKVEADYGNVLKNLYLNFQGKNVWLNTNGGRRIPVHSSIISGYSPYFDYHTRDIVVFSDLNRREINMSKWEYETVFNMVMFFYGKSIALENTSARELLKLFQLSTEYVVESIRESLHAHFYQKVWNVSEGDVLVDLFVYSHEFEQYKALKKRCLMEIARIPTVMKESSNVDKFKLHDYHAAIWSTIEIIRSEEDIKH